MINYIGGLVFIILLAGFFISLGRDVRRTGAKSYMGLIAAMLAVGFIIMLFTVPISSTNPHTAYNVMSGGVR